MFSFLKSKSKHHQSKPSSEPPAAGNGTASNQKRKYHQSTSPSLTSLSNITKKSFSLARSTSATKKSKRSNVIKKSSIGLPQTLNDLDDYKKQDELNKIFKTPSRIDLMPSGASVTGSINNRSKLASPSNTEFGDLISDGHNNSDSDIKSSYEPFKNPFTDFASRFNLTDTNPDNDNSNDANSHRQVNNFNGASSFDTAKETFAQNNEIKDQITSNHNVLKKKVNNIIKKKSQNQMLSQYDSYEVIDEDFPNTINNANNNNNNNNINNNDFRRSVNSISTYSTRQLRQSTSDNANTNTNTVNELLNSYCQRTLDPSMNNIKRQQALSFSSQQSFPGPELEENKENHASKHLSHQQHSRKPSSSIYSVSHERNYSFSSSYLKANQAHANSNNDNNNNTGSGTNLQQKQDTEALNTTPITPQQLKPSLLANNNNTNSTMHNLNNSTTNITTITNSASPKGLNSPVVGTEIANNSNSRHSLTSPRVVNSHKKSKSEGSNMLLNKEEFSSRDFDDFLRQTFELDTDADLSKIGASFNLKDEKFLKNQKFNNVLNDIKKKNENLLKSPKSVSSLKTSTNASSSAGSGSGNGAASQSIKSVNNNNLIDHTPSNISTFYKKKIPESLLLGSKNDKFKLLPDIDVSPITLEFDELRVQEKQINDKLGKPANQDSFAKAMKPQLYH